jgi:hypothetical protein
MRAVLLAGAFLTAGCGDDYGHEQLSEDSPQAREVGRMVAELRDAPAQRREDVLRGQATEGLTQERSDALADALRELAEAETVTVERVDRYGESVFQASFELTTAEGTRRAVLLLVQTDGRLRWAGPN